MRTSPPFSIRNALDDSDLEGILNLQRQNTADLLSEAEIAQEGFVTVEHSLALLRQMNADHKHVIALDNKKVVIAYALTMLKKFKAQIPVLVPMFEKIDQIQYNGIALKQSSYFIMGQICVQKKWRGKGLFRLLYQKLTTQMSNSFDYTITEVDAANPRSLQAHLHFGFQNIQEYQGTDGTKWVILLYENKISSQ